MTKKHTVELEVEDFEGSDYKFLSLIEYENEEYLCIVDNVLNEDEIGVYVVDNISKYNIEQDAFLAVSKMWYDNHRDEYPISLFFNKLNLSSKLSNVYHIFKLKRISRIVGTMFEYQLEPTRLKNRKIVFLSDNITPIKLK